MTPDAALRVSQRLIEALNCNGTNTTERQCLMYVLITVIFQIYMLYFTAFLHSLDQQD